MQEVAGSSPARVTTLRSIMLKKNFLLVTVIFICFILFAVIFFNDEEPSSDDGTDEIIQNLGPFSKDPVLEIEDSNAFGISTSKIDKLFNLSFEDNIDLENISDDLENSEFLMSTEKLSSNKVFSFGRDHGYHGRLLSHGIIAKESLHVKNNNLTGYCFTPQDGTHYYPLLQHQ